MGRLLQRKHQHEASVGMAITTAPVPALSLRERMICAAATGMVCWSTFYPLDAVRNRMYHAATAATATTNDSATANATTTSRSTNSIVETIGIMRKERSFYRGFGITLLRAGPVAAVVLPVYDLTLEWLSS